MAEPGNTLSAFYDHRYQQGYMESWEAGRLQRVRELLLNLQLPKKGRALDFGCGNGVFTGLIREALPGWEVFGTEISTTALRNAAALHPDCRFFPPEEASSHMGGFDFIFSHHVIEHVDDLDATFQLLGGLSSPSCIQLHILPCGNAGSYEHRLVSMLANGIESDRGNRFHFEEPGHLRRLTSDAFSLQMAGIGFQPLGQWFANQYWGGIDWITKTSPRFIRRITDTRHAIHPEAAAELRRERHMLMALTLWQFPKTMYDGLSGIRGRGISGVVRRALLWLPMLLALPLWRWLELRAHREWAQMKTRENGSEMYLAFTRDGG